MSDKQNQKHELKPRLRFPEFRNAGEWQNKKLGDVLVEVMRPIEVKDDDKYSLVIVKRRYGGVVSRGTLKGKEIKVKSQFILQKDDFLISNRQIVHCACGIVPNEFEGAIVSNEYSILRAKPGLDITFLDYFTQQPPVSQSFLGCSSGIVIEKMLFKLNEWLKREFCFPVLKEQQRIADCLTSIDEVITAETRKLDGLKAYKQGLLQRLFPAEGEPAPRLRLPEFRDAVEWCRDSLGKIFETSSGGTPSRSTKEYWNGRLPWITTSLVDFKVITEAEEFISERGLEASSAKMFPKGTILVAMYGQGKTRGKVAMLGIEAATNQACAAILPRDGIDPSFVFLNLANRYDEMRELSNSGGQENLSQALIRELPFSFPKDTAEQKGIIDCLTPLTELISAQEQKVATQAALKKGLMQQLFPTIDEAGE